AFTERVQRVDVVWACGEPRGMRDHSATRNPPSPLEAIIVQLFRRAVTVIGHQREAAIAWRSRLSANRPRPRSYRWRWIKSLALLSTSRRWSAALLCHRSAA